MLLSYQYISTELLIYPVVNFVMLYWCF